MGNWNHELPNTNKKWPVAAGVGNFYSPFFFLRIVIPQKGQFMDNASKHLEMLIGAHIYHLSAVANQLCVCIFDITAAFDLYCHEFFPAGLNY